jgi:hypothetical protein
MTRNLILKLFILWKIFGRNMTKVVFSVAKFSMVMLVKATHHYLPLGTLCGATEIGSFFVLSRKLAKASKVFLCC